MSGNVASVIDGNSNFCFSQVDVISQSDMSELLERANWAGALSDASDQEL